MNIAQKLTNRTQRPVEIADAPEGLAQIHRPGCAAAIWRRTPLPRFQTWIDALPAQNLPRMRAILRPDRVREALADIAAAAETPACGERDLLLDDIAALAMIFAEVMDAPYLRLRLEALSDEEGPEMRLASVQARLICAYRGAGPQFGLAQDWRVKARAFTVPTCAPIILRGGLWPENPNAGLSVTPQPQEAAERARLVLSLDPFADLGGEAKPKPHTRH